MIDDLTERIARALCALDGHEPESPFETGEMESRNLHDGFENVRVTVPYWRTYLSEAHRYLVVLKAAGVKTS